MPLDRDAVKAAIRSKLVAIAQTLGTDVSGIGDDELIPATGAIDSAGILELVVWYEKTYDIALRQDEINIDNLGSINAMADFLLARKGESRG